MECSSGEYSGLTRARINFLWIHKKDKDKDHKKPKKKEEEI